MKRVFLCVLFFPLFLGCGPKTVIVTGRVTFDGEPGKDISVLFQPLTSDAIAPPAAEGLTDADGVYKLRLIGETKKAGTIPGEYAVSFKWMDPNADPNPERPGYKPNPIPYRIPDKARLGHLRFTVPENGPATADFSFTEADMRETVQEDK